MHDDRKSKASIIATHAIEDINFEYNRKNNPSRAIAAEPVKRQAS
jgi:hypothetical protein